MTDVTPSGNEAADSVPADAQAAVEPASPPPAPVAPPAPTTWPAVYPMPTAPQSPTEPPQPPAVYEQHTAYPPAPQAAQTSSSAIVALVLAIGSWAVCPLVLAIVALVFASKADREIARSGGMLQGGGLSTAAKIVAWINIGIFVAVIVVTIFIIIIAVVAGGLSEVIPSGQV